MIKVNFYNSSISGTLNIRTNLSSLTIHNTTFIDIVVDENVTITTVSITKIDGSLEIGDLSNYGKTKCQENTPSNHFNESCQDAFHLQFYQIIIENGKIRIHYGLLAGIVIASVIAFVIFHVSYRRYKYKSYMTMQQSEEVNQDQNQQEVEGPDYYESVDLFRNYRDDTLRGRDKASDRDTYAEPDYAEI